MRLYFLLLFGVTLVSCSSNEEEFPNESSAFIDVTLCRIYDLGQRKNYAQLMPYLHHPQPAYRKAAVREFIGVDERSLIDSLLMLLNDTSEEVRTETAFTLGYARDTLLAQNLIVFLQEENQPDAVRYELVKAIGKHADSLALDWLVSYQTQDTAYIYAQAVAIAHAKRNGVLTSKATVFLQNYTDTTIAKRIRQLSTTLVLDSVLSLNLETRPKTTVFVDTLLAWEQAKNWQKYVYLDLLTNREQIIVRLYLDENPTMVTRLQQLATQKYFQNAIFTETTEMYLWELPDVFYELPARPLRGSVSQGTVFIRRERQKIWLGVAKTILPDYESSLNIVGERYR